jgi:hypothetical protein
MATWLNIKVVKKIISIAIFKKIFEEEGISRVCYVI